LALCESGGDHATAEGCGSDDGDAKFAAGGDDVASSWTFDVELEDKVVDLDGGDGGDGYCTAEGGGGDRGEADVFDFALPIKEGEGVSDVIVVANEGTRGRMLITLSAPLGRAWSPQ